jgi:hypothetical protein
VTRNAGLRGVSNQNVTRRPPSSVLPLALAALWICTAATQDHTDFSGRWVLESPLPAATDVPRALSVRQSVTTTNVRGEPMKPFFSDISIEKTFDASARTEVHRIGVLGGTVGGVPGNPAERTEYFAVTWDGDALVFEHRSRSGSDRATLVWTQRREVWSLDATGRLHVAVTTQDPVSGSRRVEFGYRRQADREVIESRR